MSQASDIKKGTVIRHQSDLYVVTFFQFVNPGKGSAFTKTKMKSLTSGKSIEITYKSNETVAIVSVQRQNMQYLYRSGDTFSFMNEENYESVELSADLLGQDAQYLKEGIKVIALMHDGSVVAIELPKKITYTVVEAPPAVKGDTASGNVTKEVICDNGLKVQVPIFIKQAEEIVVNTETGEYCGRANE